MRLKPILLLILLPGLFIAAAAQTKHALIFAIGDYPQESGWPKISSDNDTALIKKALQAQKFSDIKIVHDHAATVKGISNSLEELIERSKPGDIDVIHFSSHGEQIEDSKKHKADGLEECIVSYDAKLPNPDIKYTQAYFESLLPGYYREDMFGTYVDKLRAKLGKNGDLIVFLDLCHAGIGTRGSAKVRGGHSALVSPGFNLKNVPATDLAKAFCNRDDAQTNDGNLATYVVFGAARADELDYETIDETTQKGYGSLSYAIGKVFLNLTKENQSSNLTYRSLFARVQSVMDENASNQHPVLAGNGADRLLFGGKIVTQKPFIEIDQVKDSHITIKGGSLMGLDSGAKVSLYPAGTVDPKSAKFLDTGTVFKSSLFNSEVKFTRPVNLKQPADGWVFVTSPVFKNDPVKIGIASNKTRGANAAATFSQIEKLKIIKALRPLPGIAFTGLSDIEIRKGIISDSIVIAQTGLLFDTIKSASADTAGLKAKITRYMQYTFLKSINVRDTDALVDIKLISIINGKPDSAKMRSKDKNYSFKDGDMFMIFVTNNSGQDVYVNILDIQPDGVINPVVPNLAKKITPQELKFTAGATLVPIKNRITVGPPYGRETFKIFVSTDMIDMEKIANSRGTASRGNLKLFERLVKKSYGDQSRGVNIGLGDADGSTYNLVFDIVK
jgi:metacaspase-1